jgi:hypothetical protein
MGEYEFKQSTIGSGGMFIGAKAMEGRCSEIVALLLGCNKHGDH